VVLHLDVTVLMNKEIAILPNVNHLQPLVQVILLVVNVLQIPLVDGVVAQLSQDVLIPLPKLHVLEFKEVGIHVQEILEQVVPQTITLALLVKVILVVVGVLEEFLLHQCVWVTHLKQILFVNSLEDLLLILVKNKIK